MDSNIDYGYGKGRHGQPFKTGDENIVKERLELYKKYIQEYNIENVVVGSMFTKDRLKEKSPFSNELFYNKTSDEDIIFNEELL